MRRNLRPKTLSLLLIVFLAAAALGMKTDAAEVKKETVIQKTIEWSDTAMLASPEEEASFIDVGYCGSNVMWGLTTDGILLIVADGNGKGTMSDYSLYSDNLPPWSDYYEYIYAVYVDGNVNNIGECAFYKCKELLYACLEEGVTKIGNSAFNECSNLEEIDLPQSLKSIGGSAFYECRSLTSINIPNSVTKIGMHAFSQCRSLESANIPSNLTTIEYCLFCGCESLKNVTIPKTVTSISGYAFAGCKSFTTITIPESVKTIGTRAFAECDNLKTVNLSSGLTTIEDDAFIYCSTLEKISIPNTVKNLGKSVFEDCTNLKEAVLPESITVIPKMIFLNCANLSNVTMSSRTEIISGSAFAGCASLTTITIPSYVKTIQIAAFSNCSNLTTVRIPASVTLVDEHAFAHCSKLREVSILNPDMTLYMDVFKNDSNVLIRCIENSTAHSYAKRNGHAYEFIDLSLVTEYFDDVYTDWYTDYVQYVYDNGLMTGVKGAALFQPDANITKAQVAQVLYNMEGQPEVAVQTVFTELTDVYSAEWYANAVAWAYNTGVVTGDVNTRKFSPNADVTREQLALMIYRYAAYKNYRTDQRDNLAGLKNEENVSNWARTAVEWSVGAGLISGIDKSGVKDLAPQGNATRAQMAAILQRFIEGVVNAPTPMPTLKVTEIMDIEKI